MVTEEFLQFIWRYGLFEQYNLKAETGEEIDIIGLGQLNTDSGPDFFNSRICINGIEWAGNVEIHIRASDWKKHGHDKDKAYNNVVLHVVEEYDSDAHNTLNNKIPTLKLNYKKQLLDNFSKLFAARSAVACSRRLDMIDGEIFSIYLNNLAVERLENKTELIMETLEQSAFNWEEVFYRALARNFGFSVNAQPFVMLARAVPLKALAKQKNSLLQIEAMLFGQSGLLPASSEHPYVRSLIAEYTFLKIKYNLSPLDREIWKNARIRPVNFPAIRISQFAALIHRSSSLFSKIIEMQDITGIISLFSVKASEYWDSHYSFETASPEEEKALGEDSVFNIVINTIVPFVFIYGKTSGKQELCERAVSFLEQAPPENNKITRVWKSSHITAHNALESQALIQLFNNYCQPRKCLRCNIGAILIRSTGQLV